jgi:serine/threonine-protein kinase
MVKVLDFGISASADRTPEEQRLTIPGHALGTPEYMAPEQSKGRPPTEQFDIYALGVMLYESLAGEPPFVSENVVEVLARKATEPPPRLDMRRGGLPPPLVELVHACIEVDPGRRPANTDSFLSVLEPLVTALEGMQAMETSASGRYGILRDGPASTALALPVRRQPPFGVPPMYDGGVPPPPAYDALDAGLSRVHSRPNHSDSLVSTPVDMDFRSGPSRGAWWALASLGLVLLLLLTVGVWWQMLRERNAGDGNPQPGNSGGGDDGKGVVVKSDSGDPPVVTADGGATKTSASGGPVEPDPTTTGPAADDSKAPGDDDGVVVMDDGGGSTPVANPAESAKCKRTRESAKDAYTRRQWSEVLVHLGSKTCWKGKYRSEVPDMKIKALFETKQWAKCAALEKSARSEDATKKVGQCKQRLAAGGG